MAGLLRWLSLVESGFSHHNDCLFVSLQDLGGKGVLQHYVQCFKGYQRIVILCCHRMCVNRNMIRCYFLLCMTSTVQSGLV